MSTKMTTPKMEATIGLEIHIQLKTKSKIFSSSLTKFGSTANSQACEIDLALPGTLPTLNKEAVASAIKFGLAINAKINRTCQFDRKNYFYPDLPKGYQISQLHTPIVGEGVFPLAINNGVKNIRIFRAHLEEDAGKSIHNLLGTDSGIDLNRAGLPLLELVTEPDFHSAEEAAAFFRQIHQLVTNLGICDGQLNEGSMRCDANISVKPINTVKLGTKVEVKNLNSFRFLEQAINFEIDRQIKTINEGGVISQETRLFDPDKNLTKSMRSKEEANDYRYFPDPDLPTLTISEGWIEDIRKTLPELPEARRERFLTQYPIEEKLLSQLSQEQALAQFFEKASAISNAPKLVANWIFGDIASYLNRHDKNFDNIPINAETLGDLIKRIHAGEISNHIAKDKILPKLWTGERDIDAIIAAENLNQTVDQDALSALIQEVLDTHPEQVEQYKGGKTKIIGYLVGQVMKKTQGKADPKQINQLMQSLLQK